MPLRSELWVLEPRVTRYLSRASFESAAIVGVTALVLSGLLYVTRDSETFLSIVIFLGVVCITLFFTGWAVVKRLANVLLCVLSARQAVEVALDEGGLRLSTRDGLAYWPLERLEEPLVIGRWLGRVELVVAQHGDEEPERIVLFHPDAIAEAQGLAREVGKRIDGLRRVLPPNAQQLEPHGDDWPTWRRRIEDAVRTPGGASAFRTARLGREDLKSLVRDVRLPANVRAAAAYGLLRRAPDDAPTLLQDVLSEASPPILVTLVAIAAGDRPVVDNAAIAAALPYVSDELQSEVLQSVLRRS